MYSLGMGTLAFLFFLLETTFLRHIEINGIKPDLILIIAIYCSLFFSRTKAVSTGFILGIVQDCLSYGFLGLNGLLKGFTALIISTMKERYLNESLFVECILTFIATIINCFVIIFLTFDISDGFSGGLTNKILFMGFYNSLLVPPVFFLINKVRKRIEKPRAKSFKR